MTSKTINEFKEVMHQGMIANFKIHGFLTPVVFFYKDGEALISEIPSQLLSTQEGKSIIAAGIKDFRKFQTAYAQVTPLKRNVTADEVGNTAAFLCSDLASGITGEVVHVDAGYHAVSMADVSE